MEPRGVPSVGNSLGGSPIVDLEKRIVELRVADLSAVQLAGQPIVAVAVELQAERAPGRDPQIAQAQFLIDEIEIIVQTFTVVRLPVSPVGFFAEAWLVSGTGLNGREDSHQARVATALL